MVAMDDGGEAMRAFRRLGVAGRKHVTIITDISALGPTYAGEAGDRTKVDWLFARLREAAGDGTTFSVPTFTYHRKGPGSAYVHETSVSETGVLSEHMRCLPVSVRSIHPVFSFAAIGPAAEALCTGASTHSYGYGSVSHRLVEADSLVLGIGRSPHRGAFFIHLAEVFAGVPYRYSKELSIPVCVAGRDVPGPFFHFVKYSDTDIVWDTNRLVDRMEGRGEVRFEPLGESGIWCFRAADIFASTLAILKRNVFGLLAAPPQRRPWTR